MLPGSQKQAEILPALSLCLSLAQFSLSDKLVVSWKAYLREDIPDKQVSPVLL